MKNLNQSDSAGSAGRANGENNHNDHKGSSEEQKDNLGAEEFQKKAPETPEARAGEGSEDYLLALQRLKAEYDNYRRRTESERLTKDRQALSGLMEKLLPVLDAFEAGMEYDQEALRPVYSLLLSSLKDAGLNIIQPAAGDIFDPNFHDAVEGDLPDSTKPDSEITRGQTTRVLEVLRTGYILGGKLLRAAQVKVSFSYD